MTVGLRRDQSRAGHFAQCINSISPRAMKAVFFLYLGEILLLTEQTLSLNQRSAPKPCSYPGWSKSGEKLPKIDGEPVPASTVGSTGHRAGLALMLPVSPTLALQESAIFPLDTWKMKCSILIQKQTHKSIFPPKLPRKPFLFPAADPTSGCPKWKTLVSLNGMSWLPEPRRAQPRPPTHSLWVFPRVFGDKRYWFYSKRAKPCWYLILLLLPH